MSAKPITLTAEGLKKLKDELEYLTTTRRVEVIEMIARARALGDLSENSEYDEARDEQGHVESRITEIEEIIKNAQLISDNDISTDVINIGAHVKIYNETYEEEDEYDIVGSTEADALNNKISDHSPIGSALLGKKAGEEVVVHTPRGDMKIKILEFSHKN